MPTIITRAAVPALPYIIIPERSFNFPDDLYDSPLGNGVSTPTVSLHLYFYQSQLYTGKQFTMTGKVLDVPGAGWSIGSTYTSTFTYGTAGNQTIPTNASKQFYIRNYYDGASSVYVYGFYSGDPTSFRNGSVALINLSLV